MSGCASTVRFGNAWDMGLNLRRQWLVASGPPGDMFLPSRRRRPPINLENTAVNRVLKLALLLGLAASPLVAQKKKLAVMDFDYSQVRSSVTDMFGSDVDIGK